MEGCGVFKCLISYHHVDVLITHALKASLRCWHCTAHEFSQVNTMLLVASNTHQEAMHICSKCSLILKLNVSQPRWFLP